MKWEYRTMQITASGGFLGGRIDEASLRARLAELGDERWELVTAFATHQGYGWSRDVIAIFKREKG
jgi:hypothetical protein